MKNFSRIISLIILFSIIISFLPANINFTFAAPDPVNVYVDNLTDGNLIIHWDNVAETKSVRITYHTPPNILSTVVKDQTTNVAIISDLENDIIYDITIEIYDDVAAGGSQIGEGFLYFLPKLSFYASSITQIRSPIVGGGYEIGINPKLNLKWAIPKVWNGTTGDFQYANDSDSLDFMAATINGIYNRGISLSKLNFRINISSDLVTLNSGSMQSSILVEQDEPEYNAYVAGNSSVTSSVYDIDTNGYVNFNILGRADANSTIQNTEEHVLPDGDILPGTVYFMNIKLNFKDVGGNTVFIASCGAPADLNGSILTGTTAYTYTPLKFQVSKDSSDNIYIKIYKLNKGSLDLPRLFYEIQSSDDFSIPGDWEIKKAIDDTFFPSDSAQAITVISGINPYNEMYYKIVIKTEGTSDRIESDSMRYTLAEDTSRPPIPKDVTIASKVLVTKTIEVNGTYTKLKSSDITLSWEKLANWDQIKVNTDPNKDIVFHVLLSTSQSDITTAPYPMLESEGKWYGRFPVKFRRELYFTSKDVTQNGLRLEYKINGFELFKGRYFSGVNEDGDTMITEESLQNEDNYPTYLLPNKVYYLQMYTTLGDKRNSTDAADMSDKTTITSFTTCAGEEVDVPLPKKLRLVKNEVITNIDSPSSVSNYVELQFDKVQVNWENYTYDTSVLKSVYYDVYVSTRTEISSFKFLASTQLAGDITFTGDNDEQSTSVKVKIQKFSKDTDAYTAFGEKLKPNNTYYFIARTRLALEGKELEKSESAFTTLLSVTTKKIVSSSLGDTIYKPIAPSDFTIFTDPNGELSVSGSSATFSWTRQENDVLYNIICTKEKLAMDANPYSVNDAVYQSFVSTFGDISLDPGKSSLAKNFAYNNISKQCKFSINEWLYPNRLYYFSIRAVSIPDPNQYSNWVSIPITTSLITSADSLEIVVNPEVGFVWKDDSINAKVEDYKIYYKKSTDSKFTEAKRASLLVTKDSKSCFARLKDLEFGNSYDIKVYRGEDNEVLLHEEAGLTTRDKYHEIEVRWRGLSNLKYELAVKTVDETEYAKLTDINLESYYDQNGNKSPYYITKTLQTVGTDYNYYYARVKSKPINFLTAGTQNKILLSNTKYLIKIRSLIEDSNDSTLISYSKYIGPVDIRTEFNKDDYKKEEEKVGDKIKFLDKMNSLQYSLYWKMGSAGNTNKILIKGDRITNLILNNSKSFTILDISSVAEKFNEDDVYMPVSVLSVLSTNNKTLTIKTKAMEYTFNPKTLDIDNIKEINDLKNIDDVKDIYIKLNIKHSENPTISLPTGYKSASTVHDFKVKGIGSNKLDQDIEEQIYDRLFNNQTGIVQESLNELLDNSSSGSSNSTVDEIVAKVEKEISNYVINLVEGGNGAKTSIVDTKSIKYFSSPMITKLYFTNTNDVKSPFMYLEKSYKWQKAQNLKNKSQNSITFDAIGPGQYVIAVYKNTQKGSSSVEISNKLNTFIVEYGINEIFDETDLLSSGGIKIEEAILVYEKITQRENENYGLSIRQKALKFGLNSILNDSDSSKNLERQQASVVLMNIYSSKNGIDINMIKPTRNIFINDKKDIKSGYLNSVIMSINLSLMSLNDEYNFEPLSIISPKEFLSSVEKTLELSIKV